jgi:hypothetical protein
VVIRHTVVLSSAREPEIPTDFPLATHAHKKGRWAGNWGNVPPIWGKLPPIVGDESTYSGPQADIWGERPPNW